MKKLFLIFCLLHLCGCTVAGLMLDSRAGTEGRKNRDADLANQPVYVPADPTLYQRDNDGFSLMDLGFEIDKSVVDFFIEQSKPEPYLECRQVTRAIRECEEVSPSQNLP